MTPFITCVMSPEPIHFWGEVHQLSAIFCVLALFDTVILPGTCKEILTTDDMLSQADMLDIWF